MAQHKGKRETTLSGLIEILSNPVSLTHKLTKTDTTTHFVTMATLDNANLTADQRKKKDEYMAKDSEKMKRRVITAIGKKLASYIN